MNNNVNQIIDSSQMNSSELQFVSCPQFALSSENYKDYLDKKYRYFFRYLNYKKVIVAAIVGFLASTYLLSVYFGSYQYIKEAIVKGTYTNRILLEEIASRDFGDFLFGLIDLFEFDMYFWSACYRMILQISLLFALIVLIVEWFRFLKDKLKQTKIAKKRVEIVKINNQQRLLQKKKK